MFYEGHIFHRHYYLRVWLFSIFPGNSWAELKVLYRIWHGNTYPCLSFLILPDMGTAENVKPKAAPLSQSLNEWAV